MKSTAGFLNNKELRLWPVSSGSRDSQVNAAATARIGQRWAERFTLGELLGVGGMAAVYRATRDDGQLFAIKILHAHHTDDEELGQRLQREAKLLGRLDHPGVVKVHEVGRTEAGTVFLVMDLLSGQSLESLVERKGPLSPSTTLDIARSVLDVLKTCHARGVIHRDLKPANLFVTQTGELKVLDFGIATALGPEGAHSSHTNMGSVMGTPAYMSPEQARGRWTEVDVRSDIWSFGATLFTVLTGEHVHPAANSTEQLGLHMTLPARSVLEVAPDLPERLALAIDGALEFEKAQRWQNIEQIQRALRESGDASKTLSPVSSRARAAPRVAERGGRLPWRKRTAAGVAVAAFAFSVLLIAVAGRGGEHTAAMDGVDESLATSPSEHASEDTEPSTRATTSLEPRQAPEPASVPASIPARAPGAPRIVKAASAHDAPTPVAKTTQGEPRAQATPGRTTGSGPLSATSQSKARPASPEGAAALSNPALNPLDRRR